MEVRASPEAGPEAGAFPPPLRRALVECLERGPLLVVVLDPAGRITWSNASFRQVVLEDRPDAPAVFGELLAPDSARLLPHALAARPGEMKAIDLCHQIAAGHLTISYQFLRRADGTVIGIGVDRTEEKELIAQFGIVIEDLNREMERRAELSRKLQEIASTDFLTAVANRRQFDDVLKREWGRMRRYGNHFALIILDLDHFKNVNDRFGHQAGDEVLRRVADLLKAEVRAEDLVARYGGEEFSIIALAVDAARGRDLAERLRQRVASSPMPAMVPGLTISAGVAATAGPNPPADLDDLIARADRALYLAKERSRNRVEVA